MMGNTVTLDGVEIRSRSNELSEHVAVNLNPWHAVSGLGQVDLPTWRVKRSGILIQPAEDRRFLYTRDWEGPPEVAETYVVGEMVGNPIQRRTSESLVEEIEKELQPNPHADRYETRIASLRSEADNQDIEINEDSYSDFWNFIEMADPQTYASVMLLPRGTFRAVWRTGPDNHIGLHFTGHGRVNYVIFKSKPNDDAIEREAGIGTFSDVLSLIEEYGLKSLV